MIRTDEVVRADTKHEKSDDEASRLTVSLPASVEHLSGLPHPV
jgi:hypothetical protein